MAIAAPPRFPGVQPRNVDPTGKPSWPSILLTGPTGSGKSFQPALLSTDPRIDLMYWMELGKGETTAHEYGAIPGARYKIIQHNGTYRDIYEQLCAHWWAAKEAEERGQVYALCIDSLSGEWEMLQDLGDLRLRRREAKKLTDKGEDADVAWSPDFDAQVPHDIWTFLRKKRHGPIMSVLLSWPGPVVYTARETLSTPFGDDGQPVARAEKIWALQTHKSVPSDSTVWVRLAGPGEAEVVKLRSVNHALAIMPKSDADAATAAPSGRPRRGRSGNSDNRSREERTARPWQGEFSLARLIFDVIGCVPGESRAPEVIELDADQDMPGDAPPVTLTAQELAHARNNARIGAARILNLSSGADAERFLEVTLTNGLGNYDISEVLTDSDRETLAFGEGEVNLLTLAKATARYWREHKTSPRTPLDAEPTQEQAVA